MNNKTEVSRLYPANHIPNIENREACLTDQSLKIWFTKPCSHEPLGGIENELRLIQARVQFPEHHILLVYEPNNLTTQAHEKLNQYCQQHQIEQLSLDDIELTLKQALKNHTIDTDSVNIHSPYARGSLTSHIF
jgi:hypothetical protein